MRYAILVMGLLLATAGCQPAGNGQGDDESSAAQASPPKAGDGAGQSATRDACELLTTGEFEAIVGEPVVAKRGDSGRTWSECEWHRASRQDGYGLVLALEVLWSGGREQWGISHRVRSDAPGIVGAPENAEQEVAELIKPGEIGGIGDAAYFNELMPSEVLAGDTLLTFKMPLLPEPARNFPVLARAAVGRL